MNIWLLAAGIFCIATGFLMPVGIALCLIAVYADLTPKVFKKKDENTYKLDEYSSNVIDRSV